MNKNTSTLTQLKSAAHEINEAALQLYNSTQLIYADQTSGGWHHDYLRGVYLCKSENEFWALKSKFDDLDNYYIALKQSDTGRSHRNIPVFVEKDIDYITLSNKTAYKSKNLNPNDKMKLPVCTVRPQLLANAAKKDVEKEITKAKEEAHSTARQIYLGSKKLIKPVVVAVNGAFVVKIELQELCAYVRGLGIEFSKITHRVKTGKQYLATIKYKNVVENQRLPFKLLVLKPESANVQIHLASPKLQYSNSLDRAAFCIGALGGVCFNMFYFKR